MVIVQGQTVPGSGLPKAQQSPEPFADQYRMPSLFNQTQLQSLHRKPSSYESPMQSGTPAGMVHDPANSRREFEAIRQEMAEDEKKLVQEQYFFFRRSFETNYQQFLKLDPDRFSITRAIFICENAWYGNTVQWPQFEKAIKKKVQQVRQLLKAQKLTLKSNLNLNYGIQLLYTKDSQLRDSTSRQLVTIRRLGYDFDDFMGERDWSHMFVNKLLATGKGQCHSLPLLYLAIAEQLGAKAYLSLAPEHCFIQFFDDRGRRYHFETTNGHLVTLAWMMESTYINATAIRNKTYLDTLSKRQLYAQLLSDMLQSYINRLGYDDTALAFIQMIRSIDPKNLAALIMESDYHTLLFQDMVRKAGYPPLKKLPDYPELYSAYLQMKKGYDEVDATGYQEMPAAVYAQWLKTADTEKKRQQAQELELQLKGKLK